MTRLRVSWWVNHEFYDQQWEIIFEICIIEILKVYLNPKLSIFLPYKSNVQDPYWVLDLTTESNLFEFADFLFNFWYLLGVDIKATSQNTLFDIWVEDRDLWI